MIIVSPDGDDAEAKVDLTARSLAEYRMSSVILHEAATLDRLADLSLGTADGLLLIQAGVYFLRRPNIEDFVSPVTGDHYLFTDYPQDWCPTHSTPNPRACQDVLFLDRAVLESLRWSSLSLSELLASGYVYLGAGGEKFIWREPLVRTLTSNREIDALIATGVDDKSQRWGYLGVRSQVRSPAVAHNISNQDRARALSRLMSRSEIFRALAIRFRLVVLVNKVPYYRLRTWLGAIMLRVPVIRRFVQTG